MGQVRIVSNIFENFVPTPVLTHIFYGPTLERALEVERAHMKTDAFFNAAMTTKNYKGIKLQIERYIERS